MTPEQHARAPFIAGMLYGLAIRQSRTIEPQDIPDLKAAADLLLAYHADAAKAQEHKAMFEQALAIVNQRKAGREASKVEVECSGTQFYLTCYEARPDERETWCPACCAHVDAHKAG